MINGELFSGRRDITNKLIKYSNLKFEYLKLLFLLIKEMDFDQSLLNIKDLEQRVQYAATLPEKLVLEICAKNTELNNTICLNEDYWKIRYLRKSEAPPTTIPNSWKELYLFSSINYIWSCGYNQQGQLGQGNNGYGTDKDIPTKIPPVQGWDGIVKYVSLGNSFSILIDADDNVWSFGENDKGQLGLGHRNNKDIPTKIPLVNGWNGKAKHISTSGEHTVLIDTNDNIWFFGNFHIWSLNFGVGQIHSVDHGYNITRNIPTKISPVYGWDGKAKYVSSGGDHILFIDTNDNVWSFGDNSRGQLGLGNYGSGTGKTYPTKIPVVNGWNGKAKYVSAGFAHTILIDMDDNVWSFGSDEYSQLGFESPGDGSVVNRVIPTKIPAVNGWNGKAKYVSAGDGYTILIDMNDNVWSFGDNSNGELGLGDVGENNIGDDDENNIIDIPTKIPAVNGWNGKAKYLSAGGRSILIDMDDNVWSFGDNSSGQLGLGDETDRNIPTKIPNIKSTQACSGNNHTVLLYNKSPISSFDEITTLFSQGQIVKFDIEHNLQIHYKALQGIYVSTFVDKQGNTHHGYIRYNQQTNQLSKP